MEVDVRQLEPAAVEADLVAVGVFEDEELPAELSGARGAADARGAFRKLALLHPERPQRLLAVGLGKREELDAERARVAAAVAAKEAARLRAESLAWVVPDPAEGADGEPPFSPRAVLAAALVEGTILAAYRFDRFRTAASDRPDPPLAALTLLGEADLEQAVNIGRVAATAQNRARDLQSLPANVATPSYLAARAEEIAAAHEAVSAEVLGPEEIAAKGMGGIVAVSQGATEEPRLIVLRYAGRGEGDVLGLVGKAVTFDSGGISIKPAASMHEMKMDMSGGAAVLEAVAAIAELGFPLDIVAVVPSTENMPSGSAMRPGDIITQYNGKTVEVNNTDAEGRLILADALAYCAELGADRIVDLATLTGAVLIALGSTYAALLANDDELAAAVERAGARAGEPAWRLPLHPEYKELTKGTVADLTNAAAKRKAGTIYAASFLEEFVGDTRWAHLDIAGTAWDVGREYVGNGPTGFGVHLLVALAAELSAG